ncbi:WD40 repeat domain-containing protein [Myxosarcina sp. GI1]|uniref:WD40 repeat domain-containing protein n=1 Tax=Myxosarcina sp. GI1 TaxID=1541065 RepID=UPI00056345B7|nr:hypothetical protein [Myxosarcina sp. GI1]
MDKIIFNRLLKYSCICTIAIGFSLPSAASDRLNSNVLHSQAIDTTQKINSESRSPWTNAERVNVLEAHHRPISLLRFSPDGRLLASVEPEAIAIWQVKTGRLLRILPGHNSSTSSINLAPTDVAFSLDGNYLATTTWSEGGLIPDKAIVIWDIETGEEVTSLKEATGCQQILFGSEGNKLYGACDSGVEVWDLATSKKLFSFAGEYPIGAIALSHDGKVMATASSNVAQKSDNSYKIQLWQLDENRATPTNKVLEHHNPIAQLAFTTDDRKLVSSSYDGKIKVWNWQTEVNTAAVSLNSQTSAFSLNANGNLIASNFPNSAIANLTTGLPLETSVSLPQQEQASAIAFSPQEAVLAWAGQPPTYPNPVIFLWQPEGVKNLQSSPLRTARNEYVFLNLKNFWNKRQVDGEKAIAANKVSPIGENPLIISLEAFGLTETTESERETVSVNYPDENLAIVTLTQTNLADDSVFGRRYRAEFAPYGEVEKQLWRLVWAGEQYKCRSNRGHSNWSKDLCQ